MSIVNLMHKFFKELPPESPFTYVHVGAMGGLDKEWLFVQDKMKTMGFEPDDREFNKLKSSSTKIYFNYALSDQDNTPLTLFVSQDPGKTSLFKPNMPLLETFPLSDRFRTVDTLSIPAEKVRTLDSIVDNQSDANVDFLKVDTQGSELSILKGGAKTLDKSILGVKVEVEFQELYEGQPLFSDVDGFLRFHGFTLIDLRRVFWKKKAYSRFSGKGELVFGDALYMRRPKSPTHAQTLKYAIVCLVHGMHDLAYEILQSGETSDKQNTALYSRLKSEIQKHDACGFQQIIKSRRVGLLTDLIKNKFGKSFKGFADSDVHLGNRRTY